MVDSHGFCPVTYEIWLRLQYQWPGKATGETKKEKKKQPNIYMVDSQGFCPVTYEIWLKLQYFK